MTYHTNTVAGLLILFRDHNSREIMNGQTIFSSVDNYQIYVAIWVGGVLTPFIQPRNWSMNFHSYFIGKNYRSSNTRMHSIIDVRDDVYLPSTEKAQM